MEQLFVPRPSWVLSGSVMGWGGALAGSFDAVVFVTLDPHERLARLRARELRRYGSRVEPGGDLEHVPSLPRVGRRLRRSDVRGRNLASHERWLDGLTCPVLRLSGGRRTAEIVAEIAAWSDGR